MDELEFYKKIVDRYAENKASDAELEVFFHLLHEGKLDDILPEKMNQELKNIQPEKQSILVKMGAFRKIAAVLILSLTVAGIAFFLNKRQQSKPGIAKITTTPNAIKDIAPGGNKAVLTLSDGSIIVLDSTQNGQIANSGTAKVIKLSDGKLAYKKNDNGENLALKFSTLTTPPGGQYQLILQDGSMVWLNAASSIRFPEKFVGNQREVSITGEAYFEVAHDATKPFHVKVNHMDVQVLGTHFNINSYENEGRLSTTLLEGSIKLQLNNKEQLLQPGQQFQENNTTGETRLLSHVDLESVVAWKNGLFSYSNADLKTVMRQVARWYDVEVVFENGGPDVEFSGKISRGLSLRNFLSILDDTRIKYKIEGRVLTILQ